MTKNLKDKHRRYNNIEEVNKVIRERFEKEAHDRERRDIQNTVDGYNRWVEENSMRQLMVK